MSHNTKPLGVPLCRNCLITLSHYSFIPLNPYSLAVREMPETQVEEERESTSIKIKPSKWKEAKIEAVKHDKTVSELVEEALEAWIKEHKKK